MRNKQLYCMKYYLDCSAAKVSVSFPNLSSEFEKEPDKLSLKLQVVERSKEIEQIHEGCYLDHLYVYGGYMANNELTGSDCKDHLWVDIGLVKFTPMEASRMKTVNVVQIPLHTR